MTRLEQINATVDFLRGIGLELIEDESASGFLDTIRIDGGKIYFQPGVTSPANLLHESGHISLLPFSYRSHAGECIDDIIFEMFNEMGRALAASSEEHKSELQSLMRIS